jgi:calcineurin-like phosphoesterase
MLGKLADAVIAARPRWNDESYATRITISHLIGDQWNMETGWGLQVNAIGDNEHKIAVINWQERTFSLHEQDDHRNLENKVLGMKNEAIFTMDLEAFCEKYAMERLLV